MPSFNQFFTLHLTRPFLPQPHKGERERYGEGFQNGYCFVALLAGYCVFFISLLSLSLPPSLSLTLSFLSCRCLNCNLILTLMMTCRHHCLQTCKAPPSHQGNCQGCVSCNLWVTFSWTNGWGRGHVLLAAKQLQ